MKKKDLIKYQNSKKGRTQMINSKAFFISNELGKGKTLEQVAVISGMPYTEFVNEISEHPRLKQATIDGKRAGFAHWQTKLQKDMYKGKDINQVLYSTWIGNYMKWWNKPLPEEFVDNAVVNITVGLHKPGKKQQRLIDENV